MSDPFIQSHLRKLPLFAHLTPPQMALIAGIAGRHTLAPGTLALGEGQPSMGLLAFVSGRGVLSRRRADGTEDQVGAIGPGQFINEESLYAARAEPVSLRIVEAATVIFIPREAFLKLSASAPELRANLRVPAAAPPATRATSTLPPVNAAPPRQTAQAAAVPAPRPDRLKVIGTAATVAAAPAAVSVTSTGTTPAVARTVGAMLFRGQRADERVLYVFRRHWWAFGRHVWIPVIIAVIALGAAIAVGTTGVSPVLALVIVVVGLIAAALTSIYLYFEWRNDSIVITDERIVRIWNFLIGFENSLSEIPLDRVLEVTTDVPPGDPFAQLFGYATLHVRTAGEAANMQLDLIADARNIAGLIFAQRDQARQRMVEQQSGMIEADLQQALGLGGTVPIGASPVAAMTSPPPPLEAIDTTGLPFIRTRFLQPDGEIVYRHHGTVWLRMVFLPSLLMLAGAGLIGVSALAAQPPVPGVIGVSAGVLIGLIGFVWFFLADWDWRNDMLILGTDSVTIIRKRPLWLQNQVERMRLSQIDNVTSDVEGLIDNILNRGEVRIALIGASPTEAKRFTNVFDPQSIQSEISRRLSVLRNQRQTEDMEQQRKVTLEYLAAYHQMQAQQGSDGASSPGQVQPGLTFQPPSGSGGPPNPSAPRPPRTGL